MLLCALSLMTNKDIIVQWFQYQYEISKSTGKSTSGPKNSIFIPSFSSLLFYSFLLGSGSDRGRCPVEHRGEIPSVRPSVRPSIHPGGSLSQPPDSLSQPWGGMYRRTDIHTDGWTEFPPCVLQDIVPYWVRCPKGRKEEIEEEEEEKNKSPKGIKRSAVPLPCHKLWC